MSTTKTKTTGILDAMSDDMIEKLESAEDAVAVEAMGALIKSVAAEAGISPSEVALTLAGTILASIGPPEDEDSRERMGIVLMTLTQMLAAECGLAEVRIERDEREVDEALASAKLPVV